MNFKYLRWISVFTIPLSLGSFLQAPAYATTADEALSLADMTRGATQRIAVQQAVMAIASEASDVDGDGYVEAAPMPSGPGPSGGGIIPLTSSAPKDDSYGTKLGYCSWDNGSSNSSAGRISGAVSSSAAPVFAVISAGIDNVFATSCADIAAGTGAKGDDFVISYNSAQLQMGSGSLFFGDPVTDVAALNALNSTSLKDGQTRLVKSTNALYRWNAGSSTWNSITAVPWLASGAGYVSNDQVAAQGGNPIGMANGAYYFRVGSEGGGNVVYDYSGLQARNNGVAAPLNINPLGGNVNVGGNMVAWNTVAPGTTVGALHLGTVSATSNAGSAITFEARDGGHGLAQAGIYVQSDGSYGTKMLFGTTNDYSAGSKTALMIDHHGDISIMRGSLYLGAAGTGISVSPGAVSDPYGAIAVTRPGDGNAYSYFGMTRQGQVGYNIGIDASNRFFIGTGTAGYGNTNVASRIFAVDYAGNVDASGVINAGNNITINGAQVLSAANFNNYAPTLAGAGAYGTWGISISGNAATANSAGLLSPQPSNLNVNTLPGAFASGQQLTFVSGNQGWFNYGTVVTTKSYADGGGTLQTYIPYSPSYGGVSMKVRFGNYDAGNAWTAWKTILADDNFNQFAPTLTGGGASGTWNINVNGAAGSVPWSGVTGKPTTVAGYGISDFVSSNGSTPVAADSTTTNGLYYVNGNIGLFGQSDGALYVQGYSSAWAGQIYQDYRSGQLAVRGKNSGAWQAWRTIVDSGNFNNFAPTLTGGGASGTWNINVTGSAASATLINAPDGDRNAASKLPTTSGHAVRFDFVTAGSAGTSGSYAGVMTYAPWDGTTGSTGDASYQLAFGSTAINGGGIPQLNIRKGIDSSWNAWYTIWHSGNLNPQVSSVGNSVVQRDPNGYVFGNYINMSDEGVYGSAGAVTGIITKRGDNYYRNTSAASVKAYLGITQADVAGLTTSSSPTFAGGTFNGSVNVSHLYANGSGQASGATSSYYDIGGGYIAAGKSVYSYGLMCVGNNSGDCTGAGGAIISSSAMTIGGSNVLTAANISSNVNGSMIYSVRGDANSDIGVAKMMRWKNYGSGHVIFDASNGTAPEGQSISNRDAQVPWSGSYPTLMGWNGSNTYGVRVDSARVADSATNANYATTAGVSNQVNNDAAAMTFHWSGQSGQPAWLWGSSNPNDMYVYNPSNFSVNYANSAGTLTASATINDVNNNGWYRSNGDQGWFSTTYGGGIYMTDTTWVRAYNGRSLKTDAWLYAGAGLQIAGNVVIDGSRNITANNVNLSGNIQNAYDGWGMMLRNGAAQDNAQAQNSIGSAYVNDVYIRSIGKWASQLASSGTFSSSTDISITPYVGYQNLGVHKMCTLSGVQNGWNSNVGNSWNYLTGSWNSNWAWNASGHYPDYAKVTCFD